MNPQKAHALGITSPVSPEAKIVAVLCVSTGLGTGVQTVTGPTRDPIPSPCCQMPMRRQLPGTSIDEWADALAWGRPGIGNEQSPFTCPCGLGYVVVPNPSRAPAERTRILKEVSA